MKLEGRRSENVEDLTSVEYLFAHPHLKWRSRHGHHDIASREAIEAQLRVLENNPETHDRRYRDMINALLVEATARRRGRMLDAALEGIFRGDTPKGDWGAREPRGFPVLPPRPIFGYDPRLSKQANVEAQYRYNADASRAGLPPPRTGMYPPLPPLPPPRKPTDYGFR